jgi:hypothetical protein
MIKDDMTRSPATALLRLGLLAGLLAVAGCSEPAASGDVRGDKANDPELKASMERRQEIYNAKSQVIKRNPVAASKRGS